METEQINFMTSLNGRNELMNSMLHLQKERAYGKRMLLRRTELSKPFQQQRFQSTYKPNNAQNFKKGRNNLFHAVQVVDKTG